jgi:sulfur-oxidizing protein SoxX
MQMKIDFLFPAAGLTVAVAAVLAGCASQPAPETPEAALARITKTSFTDKGIATMSRLQQDMGQKACSSATAPSKDVAAAIMADAKSTVKWPSGGQYFGDWRAGEKLAQNGKGMTWKEKSAAPASNGGNCYNCHQISKQEVSYGTIGPSLYNYGKNKGITDVTAPGAQRIVQFTWAKLYNSKADKACSNMPRFGHAGVLDETQLRNLMSLLLDPTSPVNQ